MNAFFVNYNTLLIIVFTSSKIGVYETPNPNMKIKLVITPMIIANIKNKAINLKMLSPNHLSRVNQTNKTASIIARISKPQNAMGLKCISIIKDLSFLSTIIAKNTE